MKDINFIKRTLSTGLGSVLTILSCSALAIDQISVIQSGMTADKFKIVQDALTAGIIKCDAGNQPQLNANYLRVLQDRDMTYAKRNAEQLNIVKDAIKANLVQCMPANGQPQLNHSYIQELQRRGKIKNVGIENGSRCM